MTTKMNEAEVTMNDPQDKLDWLAFRYVANELNALERVAFEGQLATDQSAREAVARMVRRTEDLSLALRVGTAPTIATTQDSWKDVVRWTTVGLASCLALVAALLVSRQVTLSADDAGLTQQVSRPAVEPLDLAYAWAEARTPRDDFAEVLSELPVFNDISQEEADQTDEAALGPPSWMIAAVARMDRSLSDGTEP